MTALARMATGVAAWFGWRWRWEVTFYPVGPTKLFDTDQEAIEWAYRVTRKPWQKPMRLNLFIRRRWVRP